MKTRVTVSIAPDLLRYIDKSAGRRRLSRSRFIEALIRDARRRRRAAELGELARTFFAVPETREEVHEREGWLSISAETQKRDR